MFVGAVARVALAMSEATRGPGPGRVAAGLAVPLVLGLVAAALGRAVGGVL